MAGPVNEVLAPLAAQAATGGLTVDVGSILTFEQTAEGLATIAGGNAKGKIVIKIVE